MTRDLEGLRDELRGDPGRAEFPFVAEWLRQQGELQEALQVAAAGVEAAPDCREGRIALVLALLDVGDAAAAQRELEEVLLRAPGAELLRAAEREPMPAALAAEIGEHEIEHAFDAAESRSEEMMSANEIAERALEQTLASDPLDDANPELMDWSEDDVETEPPVDWEQGPALGPYATETMASLLELQGDSRGARAIRDTLGQHARGPSEVAVDAAEVPGSQTVSDSAGDADLRAHVIATLERWLQNIRRRVR